MKPKVNRGNNIRGLLSYALGVGSKAGANKQAEIVGGNMSGGNLEELTEEFTAIQRLRPDIARPVWHCSLSLPFGERLPSGKWSEVISAFMALMKFPNNIGHVGIRHQDTDFDHIHLAVCRVGLDGRVWLGRNEAFCAITAVQALEKKFGLTLTPGLNGKRPDVAPPTNGELNEQKRTGDVPLRLQLQAILDQAVADNPSASVFAKRLQAENVGVRVNFDKKGEINGISFELEGALFKGSALGKNYAWPGLQKRGLSYERERDYAALANFGRQTDQPVNRGELSAAVVVEGSEQTVGSFDASPHVEAIIASKNTDNFEPPKLSGRVFVPDAVVVHAEIHDAEAADPSVVNSNIALIEQISPENSQHRISNEGATTGGNTIVNNPQDIEVVGIQAHIAETTKIAQAEMEIDSGLVGLFETEEEDGDFSGVDSNGIISSGLLTQSAEDSVLDKVVDEKEYLLAISAGAVEDDIQIRETIQESATKDTLLTEGEDPIVQSRLLAADESSFSAENVSDNKTVPEESHKELEQAINQSGAVIEVVALEDKNIGTASVVSETATPLVTQAEPSASQVAVVSDKETMSKKLAELDEKLSSKIAPKGPGM